MRPRDYLSAITHFLLEQLVRKHMVEFLINRLCPNRACKAGYILPTRTFCTYAEVTSTALNFHVDGSETVSESPMKLSLNPVRARRCDGWAPVGDNQTSYENATDMQG